MGYILTRRYVIDADTPEELAELFRAGMLKSDTPEEEIDETLLEIDNVEVADEVCSSFDVGDLTDAVALMDTYLEDDVNVRPYFTKYSVDDIKAWHYKKLDTEY